MARGSRHRYILISLHDVTPLYEMDVRVFLREFKERKLHKVTLAIIPRMNELFNTQVSDVGGRYSLLDHPGFVRTLKAIERQGGELMLHGLDHADGKFIFKPKEFAHRLNEGEHIFRKAFGHPSKGYLPPRWMTARATDKILARRYAYSENLTGIRLHRIRKKIFGFPISMESLSDNEHFQKDRLSPLFVRILAKANAAVVTTNIVRYSLHPREVRNGNFRVTLALLDQFLKKGYVPITYNELERLELKNSAKKSNAKV